MTNEIILPEFGYASPALVCLVSDQPVPNLAVMLDPAFAAMPAVLVAAPERIAHGQFLAHALDRHGIVNHLVELRDGFALDRLREDFARLRQALPHGVLLNLTGGTKPMAIAAWEAFDRVSDRTFYVDIRNDTLVWWRPFGAPQPLADRFPLETLFLANGLSLDVSLPPNRTPPHDREMQELRQRLREHLGKDMKASPGGGGWLERLVFGEIAELARRDGKITDCARSFRVRESVGNIGSANEIDVAVLRDNALWLIECKTGHVGKGAGAMVALFKLATLRRRLGGMRSGALFVTTQKVSEMVCERGRQLGVGIIDRSRLGNLQGNLAGHLAQPPWR
ncbi:Card1-like endonuclease domain-containing protein [Sulfuricystis multivorans]|uniref:Card1-like endonuclease domain-containing protein n=1 Tax=Sulfuricystis multivorans TaxID=2211108 RepID=UPI000F84581C|nr:DUF1887 family CARF protein [Sulfuricystis multivorans]